MHRTGTGGKSTVNEATRNRRTVNIGRQGAIMTTKRRNTEERRKQIINAARELIVKYGSEYVTARAVDISEAAIYRHFKSKADIFHLLADNIEENLVGDIERGLSSSDSSLDTVDRVIMEHISAIEQRHGISHQVIADIISMGDKKLNARFFTIVSKYINNLAELISRGMKSQELRQDIDPQVAAMQLYGMIQGLVNVWALSDFSFNLVERYKPLWRMFRDSISIKQPE
jgi:AcrR family transcriptional regulator